MVLQAVLALVVAATLQSTGIIAPLTSVVASLLGAGVLREVVSFLLHVLLGWFLAGKAISFIQYAFGGGIARYNTSKPYRRTQAVVFVLLMSLFFLPIPPAIFTLSPMRVYSDNFYRRAEVQALQAADIEYQEAISRRNAELNEARAIAQTEFEDAKLERELSISNFMKNSKDILITELSSFISPLEDDFGRENMGLYWDLASYPGFGIGLSNEIQNFLFHAYTEFDAAEQYSSIPDEIRINTSDKIANFLNLSTESVNFYIASNRGMSCDPTLEEKPYCDFLALILWMSPRTTADLEQKYNEDFSNVLKLSILLETVGELSNEDIVSFSKNLEIYYQALEYTNSIFQERAIAQAPEVDPAAYTVDEADYPVPSRANFQQDINAVIDSGTLEEGFLVSAFAAQERYWHFFMIAAVALWVLIQETNKAGISKIYSRLMRILDQGRFGRGGSARFAAMFEEWGRRHNGRSLYMGKSLFNPWDEIGLDGEAHMLTVAGSRGGKGSSVIIPNLLEWTGSAVVIDPKGTNANVTAQARRDMGQDVHIIDPFGIVTKDSARFDPLEKLDATDEILRELVGSISDALVHIPPETKDPHWDEGAKTIISGLIAHMLSSRENAKWLPNIRDLISQLPQAMDDLWEDMAVSKEAFDLPRDVARRVLRGVKTNEILSIMSNVDKHTEWLANPKLARIMSNPTFKLTDLRDKPTTIYLVIPPRAVKRHRRLIRLFVNLVIDTAETGGRSPTPILMMIDEFLSLGRMDEFPEAFQTMASYNLIMWPFVQNMGRMQELYGKDFNEFESSSRAIQVFSVSDKETREFISEKLGNRPLANIGSVTRSNENIALRSPDDVEKDIAPDSQRQYIIERGKPPMLIERVPYFKGKRFAGQYAPDPDYSG